MNQLSDEQLQKLPTHRLLALFASVRARESNVRTQLESRWWCCEDCKQYRGLDYEEDVEKPLRETPYPKYKGRIKAILDKREHVA